MPTKDLLCLIDRRFFDSLCIRSGMIAPGNHII